MDIWEKINKRLGFDYYERYKESFYNPDIDIEIESPFYLLTDEEKELIMESINKRLGFDFWERSEESFNSDVTEDHFEIESPFHLLTDREQSFIYDCSIEKLREKMRKEQKREEKLD